jgi:hypothetical protein
MTVNVLSQARDPTQQCNTESAQRAHPTLFGARDYPHPAKKATHMAAFSIIPHIWLTMVSCCLASANNAATSFHTLVERIYV